MRGRASAAFTVSAALGAAIWAASPRLTGRVEPWDAEGPYYGLALLVSGFLIGLGARARGRTGFFATFGGLWVGQLVYALVALPIGPLIVLGVVFFALYSAWGALWAMAGSRVGRRLMEETRPIRVRDALSTNAQFRDHVQERGRVLRTRSNAELQALADSPVEQLTFGGREASIATIVEPRAGGALRVVVQGFLHGRFIDMVKRVALDGFYKHPDESITAMPHDEFYEFD